MTRNYFSGCKKPLSECAALAPSVLAPSYLLRPGFWTANVRRHIGNGRRELANKFKNITVDPGPIYIRDGNTYTTAGITAGMDLALALVEDDLGADRKSTRLN